MARKFGLDDELITDSFEGQLACDTLCESMLEPLTLRSQLLLEKIWALVDPAELGVTQPEEIRQRFDSRRFNDGCVYLGRYQEQHHRGSYRIVTLLDEM